MCALSCAVGRESSSQLRSCPSLEPSLTTTMLHMRSSMGQSSSSSLMRGGTWGSLMPLPSLCRMYSLNWDESTPPPHEHTIQKPLCCNRSNTCRRTQERDEGTGLAPPEGGFCQGVAYLHRVQEAAAAEREATDVCGVQGGREDLSDLWEDLCDHSVAGADADPLAKLWSNVNHNTLWTRASVVPLPPPVLQLGLQRSQLEETGLLIQQGELLQQNENPQRIHSSAARCSGGNPDRTHRHQSPYTDYMLQL